MKCCVQYCTNDSRKSTKTHGISFHFFPKKQHLRAAWLEALGLTDWEPNDRSVVCSEHFNPDAFSNTAARKRTIRSDAVPVSLQQPEDWNDEEAPAALKACRICLAINTRMYSIRDVRLYQAYVQLMCVTISEEDKLPQKLCWECAGRLHNCARFKARALRSQGLMMEALITSPFLSIKNVKSIKKAAPELKSSLKSKYYKPNGYNIHIHDNQIIVKSEAENGDDGNDLRIDDADADGASDEDVEELDESKKDGVANDQTDEQMPQIPPIVEVEMLEVKDEQNNDIFFAEYFDDQDFNESDDDKKLSEVLVEKKVKKEKKMRKKKMEKKARVKVKRSDVDEETDPNSTLARYKKEIVKRRKTQGPLDETLFTITTMTYEEQIAEVEKRQEMTSYKTAPFKCTICYRGFLVKDRYDVHLVKHSEANGAFECFICKTRLKTARALRKHLTAQHTEKFVCKGCPFVTRNRGVAREHEKWHAGTRYQCPHCPSDFDKITTYMGHIRIKHVSDFVCELCGYTFVSGKGIEVHKKKKHRLHDGSTPLEGPYCEVCDVKFISEEAHTRHLKLSSKHIAGDDDPNRIRNDSQSMNCEKSGRAQRRFERRPIIHPRDAPDRDRRLGPAGPVTCEQCGIQLRDLRLYAQHFRRTHPDKNRTKYPAMKTPCMCEQCGRIFQSMALLKDHMWVHTGEKRFKCDRCEKSFTQKTNLVFHMRVHSATRPTYECPLCGKHFAFFNNRRRHMFIHTGLKPFKCDSCGKCFTTSGELRAHVDHVHMKKPWPKRARARQNAWRDKCPSETED